MVTGGDGQRGQSLVHNERNLDILVQRQGAIADYIDVDLVELAETALLGPLSAPDLLNLVALEREVEDSGVVDNITGERNRQVEVKAEPPGGVRVFGIGPISLRRVGLEAGERIDLLGGFPFPRQFADGLDGTGLDAAEAVKLEGAAQSVEEVLLDDAARREPLGEAGDG